MKVLSIDPGYDRCGVAVIEKDSSGKELLLFSTCIQTSNKDSFDVRLTELGLLVEDIISKHSPSVMAIEKLFFNTNQKTGIDVSKTTGMLIYISKKAGLDIYEYTPLQIKVAITGYGRSTKEQVTIMVPNLIEINKEIKIDDEWDAIAVGLTCLASERF